uniref:Uncharacterized protein n=1 Tax=Mycena chlorophos TaxID=658473 RepID=A0ABQ0M5A0_MYCCL|nr:predicted protein [Mycena chlorophos]
MRVETKNDEQLFSASSKDSTASATLANASQTAVNAPLPNMDRDVSVWDSSRTQSNPRSRSRAHQPTHPRGRSSRPHPYSRAQSVPRAPKSDLSSCSAASVPSPGYSVYRREAPDAYTTPHYPGWRPPTRSGSPRPSLPVTSVESLLAIPSYAAAALSPDDPFLDAATSEPATTTASFLAHRRTSIASHSLLPLLASCSEPKPSSSCDNSGADGANITQIHSDPVHLSAPVHTFEASRREQLIRCVSFVEVGHLDGAESDAALWDDADENVFEGGWGDFDTDGHDDSADWDDACAEEYR